MISTKNEDRDPLTGVENWKYTSNLLPRILDHNGEIALILMDVDYMKSLNDARGRVVGDETLIGIARQIEALSGAGSLVFRFGSDEFGVILFESSLQDARAIAETLRAARPSFFVEIDGKQVETLTFSLGIAHFPTRASHAEDLISAARLALSKAKNDGRNRVMAIEDFLNYETQQPGN